MPAPLPIYYTTLGPFRGLFETGFPVLTCHKLGSPRAGARLKGLYLPVALFDRQLAELREAGFPTRPLECLRGTASWPARSFALTFDDGFQSVLEHGLAPLARHGFQAVQFLVSGLIGKTNEWEQQAGEVAESLMDAAQVRDWLGAGHIIGSHGLTHQSLTRLSLSQAREEITASKKRIEDTFGVSVNHFCYPYGDWSPAVRELVREAGYLTASSVEPGVNPAQADRLALKRITVRYRSRTWRGFREWLAASTQGLRPHRPG